MGWIEFETDLTITHTSVLQHQGQKNISGKIFDNI